MQRKLVRSLRPKAKRQSEHETRKYVSRDHRYLGTRQTRIRTVSLLFVERNSFRLNTAG